MSITTIRSYVDKNNPTAGRMAITDTFHVDNGWHCKTKRAVGKIKSANRHSPFSSTLTRSSRAQICILTTNLREQLDPALIRKGRVDFQVRPGRERTQGRDGEGGTGTGTGFGTGTGTKDLDALQCFAFLYCTSPSPFTRSTLTPPPGTQVRFDFAADEQLEKMWAAFYPAAADRAADFRSALRASLEGRDVTTADLQHLFVTQVPSRAPVTPFFSLATAPRFLGSLLPFCPLILIQCWCLTSLAMLAHAVPPCPQMRSSAEEALAAAGSAIADELRQREADAAAEARRIAAEKEAADAEKKAKPAKGGGDAAAESAVPARHVHLHLHADERVVVEVAGGGEMAEGGGEDEGNGSGEDEEE
jgi:hypothetical protein